MDGGAEAVGPWGSAAARGGTQRGRQGNKNARMCPVKKATTSAHTKKVRVACWKAVMG